MLLRKARMTNLTIATETIKQPFTKSDLNKKGLCDYVVNVATGCIHGCTFCLSPQTLILYSDMSWRPLANAKIGDILFGFDEHPTNHIYRYFKPSKIEGIRHSRQQAYRLITPQTEVIATGNHGWLTGRTRWRSTDALIPQSVNHEYGFSWIKSIGKPLVFVETPDYMAGYITGMTLGDGTIRFDPNEKYFGDYTPYWRVALCDFEPLERLVVYAKNWEVDLNIRQFYGGSEKHRAAKKVETRAYAQVKALYEVINTPIDSLEYSRGFLAGFFDAEGSFNSNLRLSQKTTQVLEVYQGHAEKFGFSFELERFKVGCFNLRLLGGMSEQLRFFSVCRPAIIRKSEYLYGMAAKGMWKNTPVVDKIPIGEVDVIDIQTSTHTFFANGLATHNCYVPSTPVIRMRKAELLGRGVVDAQMEWGQYLFLREDIPEILDSVLAGKRTFQETPSGQGVVLLCSGTDPYQNMRTAKITRKVVKTLLKHGKRVRILTRSPLWFNDLDILVHPDVTIGMSIPHDDDALSRQIEPKAPRPSDRLKAMEQGLKAGCRLYVAMAPTPPPSVYSDERLVAHIHQLAQFNPEVLFWEPINARGSNAARMIEGGLHWAGEVSSRKAWAENFFQQWSVVASATSDAGIGDRLHVWADPDLLRADPATAQAFDVESWFYKPTPERWGQAQQQLAV